MNIPEDADGDAIRRVLNSGSDPASPMVVDFMIACPDVAAAERIAVSVASIGYTTSIKVDEDDHSVTCYCTKRMILLHRALISSQDELDSLAKSHGGYIDGWGTFGNVSGVP